MPLVKGQRLKSTEEQFWSKVDKRGPNDCWEWVGAKSSGIYGNLVVAGKAWKAHRLSYELNVGPIPKGEGFHGTCVCHRCDNPGGVNPNHLFLGTQADNNADMAAKGREVIPEGEAHGMARLDPDKVREIRRGRGTGETLAVLAERFGVGTSTVHSVVSRATWKHVV